MPKPTPIVTTDEELEECCRAWRSAGRFAFDTEFIRDDTFDAILCLIQVADGTQVTLIDPVDGMELEPFWSLVADPDVLTVVHAGKEDFDLCYRYTGCTPKNVFDVQIGAGFVGLGYPLSLARLVGVLLDARLTKAATLTDWLRRPLTTGQVRYAVDDVRYLPAIHAELAARIGSAGRTHWVDEEFEKFEDAEFYRPPPEERVARIRGSRRLDGLGLAVLGRLVTWRDNWAREKNRPTRALMRDDILVEIARRRPHHASELSIMRGFPQARNPVVVEGILAEIRAAEASPPEEWPVPPPMREDSPMDKAALDVLSACLRAVCFEERVDAELVGTSQRLREVLAYVAGRRSEPPSLLAGWRAEFIGRRLVDLLEGRSELHLSGWPDAFHIEIVSHNEQELPTKERAAKERAAKPRTRPRKSRSRRAE